MNNYRYELKYILEEFNHSELDLFLIKNKIKKSYPCRKVNSLYFDELDYTSVKDNLSGIGKRKKIRLRWYDNNIEPFLEIKIKNSKLGHKEKIKIESLKNVDINKLTARELFYEVNNSIKRFDNSLELNTMLFPNLKVSYQRNYFETKNNLRVTIDDQIKFNIVNLNQEVDHFKQINYYNKILEIKFNRDLFNFSQNLISDFGIRPQRMSKYLLGLSQFGLVEYT